MGPGMLSSEAPNNHLGYGIGQDQLTMNLGLFPYQDSAPSECAIAQDRGEMSSGMLPIRASYPPGKVSVMDQATVSAAALGVASASFACTQPGCQAMFRRDTDRIRHEASKHGVNGMLHFCQVLGCPKSLGAGYTRKDKLTEHMWKKHADLGFTKRV